MGSSWGLLSLQEHLQCQPHTLTLSLPRSLPQLLLPPAYFPASHAHGEASILIAVSFVHGLLQPGTPHCSWAGWHVLRLHERNHSGYWVNLACTTHSVTCALCVSCSCLRGATGDLTLSVTSCQVSCNHDFCKATPFLCACPPRHSEPDSSSCDCTTSPREAQLWVSPPLQSHWEPPCCQAWPGTHNPPPKQ